MQAEFNEVITSEEQLREVLGFPAPRNIQKVISRVDKHCRIFIEKSPFLLLATYDQHGKIDVSPKGDPPGFVQILDEQTLAIPDRPGNRRADSLTNILQNSRIGMLFMIPGKSETLRVNGSAQIVRDTWLREKMQVNGKVPALAIVVKVEEAFVHCAKCVIRSHLWETELWPDLAGISSIAQVIIDHANLTIDINDYQQAIDENLRNELY